MTLSKGQFLGKLRTTRPDSNGPEVPGNEVVDNEQSAVYQIEDIALSNYTGNQIVVLKLVR